MKKFSYITVMTTLLTLVLGLCEANAGVTSKAISKATRTVMKKFGREAAEMGSETISKKLTTLSGKYGDDVIKAATKTGPKALRAIEEAGEENAKTAAHIIAKYGDDAIRVTKAPTQIELVSKYGDFATEALMRHGNVAEIAVRNTGREGARALCRLSNAQEVRRFAQLSEETALFKGEGSKLIDIIRRYGDPAMDFIWKNKGALAVGTTLAVFLANPKPFIDGTEELGEAIGKEAIKGVGQVIIALLESPIGWALTIFLGFFGFLQWRKTRLLATIANNTKKGE